MNADTTIAALRKLDTGEWTHPSTGEVRFYINDVAGSIKGLWIDRYNTGNISAATLNGEHLSNSAATKALGGVDKVWVTVNADGVPTVHWKGWKVLAWVIEGIEATVAEAIAAEEAEAQA